MLQAEVTIQNRYGIHCRPSTLIIRELSKFSSVIEVEHNGHRIVIGSPLELIALGLTCGEKITIYAQGEDEKEALACAIKLFSQCYDFTPQ